QVQQKLQEVFSDKPCRFVFVDQAGESIVQLAMESPNLIILGLELPDGDGVDTLSNIRDFDDQVPIIALTGAPTKEKLIAAKRACVIDILLKPPDYQRIYDKASNTLWLHPDLMTCMAPDAPAGDAQGQPGAAQPAEISAASVAAAIQQEMAPEPFVEAIPKGAEVLNINDVCGGMKVARTLVFNEIVYSDKGQILTDDKIRQLSRIGVPEVCVYIDPALKRRVAERKKAEAAKPAMGAQTASGEKSFTKVKRNFVRVEVNEPTKIIRTDKEGARIEEDGIVADVSAGGCALLSREPFNKNEEILLDFIIDDGKFQMKDVKGIVRHSLRKNGTEDFPIRSGVFFSNVTEKFRENLVTVIFKIDRDNKRKEDELRARYGYGPKKRRH
ncbi:MAG TPA: response regulator, partial [bacterium]|nr:response regulator [bacterium]